jgi:PAS domain S-box-containing protein
MSNHRSSTKSGGILNWLRTSIRAQLGASFAALTVVSILVVAVVLTIFSVNQVREALTDRVFDELEAVRTLKAIELRRWIEERKSDIRFIRDLESVQGNLEGDKGLSVLAEYKDTPSDAAYRQAFQSAERELRAFVAQHGQDVYNDVQLVDTNGEIVFALNQELREINDAEQEIFQNALNSVYFGDLFYNPTDEALDLRIGAPVKDLQGVTVGVIILELNPQQLDELMIERTGLGETGETYLIGQDYLFRNDSRFLEALNVETTILNEDVVVDTVAVLTAFDGQSRTARIEDYRGQTVLSSWTPIIVQPATPTDPDGVQWALVAEIDDAEALASVNALTRFIAGLSAVLIVLASAVAIGSGVVLANRLINPIVSLTESATQIAAGDLETKVPTVDRDDEVGLLARAFGQMTDNLQNSIRTLRQRGKELESRDQELRARTEQLEANQRAVRVVFAASEQSDPGELLRLTVNLIRDRFDMYHVQVYIVEEEKNAAVLRESTGYAGLQLLQKEHQIPLDQSSLVTQAIHGSEPVVVNDVNQNPDFLANPLLPDTQSEMVVPLKVEERIIGAVDIQSRDTNTFTSDVVGLFETMTNQIALLFQNSELYARTMEQTEELTNFTTQLRTAATVSERLSTILDPDELLNEVVELLQSRFGFYHAHIYMLDEKNERLVVRAGSGEVGEVLRQREHSIPTDSPQSLVARAARERQVVVVNDTTLESGFLPNPLLPQTRAEVAVPLITGGNLLGVLDVQDDQPERFAESDLATFNTLAGQIATALDNARLFEEQRRLTAILRNSRDLVALTNLQGEITYMNEAGAELAGYDRPEETLGKVIADFHTPEDFALVNDQAIPQVFKTGVWQGENRIRRPDGALIPIAQTIFVIQDDQGQPQSLATIITDITDRKQAEQQLIQRAAELQTVAEVGTAAATELDPDELLQDVVNLTKENFDLYHAHIYLIDDEGETLELAAGAGEAGREMVAEGWSIPANSETSLVARAFRSGQGVIENDVQAASDFLPNLLLPETASELAVPLIAGDKVLGVLDVQSEQVEHFTPQDVNIQTTLAGQVATALDNARLFEEQRQAEQNIRNLAQQNELILNSTAEGIYGVDSEGVTTFVNAAAAEMLGWSPDDLIGERHHHLIHHTKPDGSHYPVEECKVYAAYRDGQIHEGEDEIYWRKDGTSFPVSYTSTPIKDDDGTILGAVVTFRDITEELAAREATEKRARELQTVAEVGTAAATELDPDELLQDVVNLTKENFDLYHAHIYLIDDEGETLELAAGAGEAGREMVAEGWSIPANSETSLVARAFRSGQGVIENDVQAASDFLPNLLLPETASELAVPLIAGDKVLGVLDVQSEQVEHFTPQDVNIQTTLAGQIATALDNARLFEEQRRLTALLNNSDDYIAIANPQGEIIYVNPGGAEMTGYDDPSELIGMRIADSHTPEDTARVLEEGVPVAMEEGTWRGDNRLKHRDGHLIPVDQTLFIIRDEDDEVESLATIMIDITDRLEAERRIREVNERFTLAKESINLGVWDWDVQNDNLVWDDTMYKLYGINKEDFSGAYEAWTSGLHPDDAEASAAALQAALEGKGEFDIEFRVVHSSGKIRHIKGDAVIIRDDDGAPLRAVGMNYDITDQKRAEQELIQRAAELQTVAEVSTSAATVLDPDELLQDVVDLTKENFSLYHAHIYLIDDAGETLELAAGAGEAGRQMVAEGWSIPADSETSLVARAFRSREGVIVNDVREAPDFLPNPYLPDTRAEMAVPMLVGERVVGVLDVQSEQVGRFTQEDVNIKTTLAEQVATALDNARLFAEQRRLTAILNNSEDFIALTNLQGGITYINPGGMDMLGYENLEEIMTKAIPDFHTPEDTARVLEEGIPVAMEKGIWRGENRLKHREGYLIPVDQTVFVIRNDEGEVQNLATIMIDVTEQKEAERQLRQRAAELQTVAEVSTSAATVLEPEELLQEVVDLTKEDFDLYHAHIYLIDDEGKALKLAAGAGEAGQQMVAEGWSIPANSETSLVARAYRSREGVIVNDVREAPDFLPNPHLSDTRAEMAVPMIVSDRVLGVLDVQSDKVGRFTQQDVNIQTTLAGQVATALDNARLFQEAQQVADRLREVDRMKSEFLANMSHELRTPLNSILGYTQLLLLDLEDTLPQESMEDMQSIHLNGQHLLSMINDILDLAKIEAGRLNLNFEALEIGTLLESVQASNSGLFLDKPIEMVIDMEEDVPAVWADSVRMTQVLNNLVANAVKFTDEGKITIRAYQVDDGVNIEVEDEGIGINEEDMDKLFERFRQIDGSYTRRAEGTGLGLPITRHLVEMHGGVITVESEVGVGSTFTIHLPNIEAAKAYIAEHVDQFIEEV